MPINETVYLHRNHRVCIGKNGNQKIWNKYSFWTHASDVWFDDGATLENKISNLKGITNNIDSGAGYAADITLVKSMRDSLKNLIDSLSRLVNSINDRLGGLRFYEDSNGKWVVGADSVPKKLGSGMTEELPLSLLTSGNNKTEITAGLIDFTGHDFLKLVYDYNASNREALHIDIYKDNTTYLHKYLAKGYSEGHFTLYRNLESVIDVRDIQGEYYIRLWADNDPNSGGGLDGLGNFTVKSMTLFG